MIFLTPGFPADAKLKIVKQVRTVMPELSIVEVCPISTNMTSIHSGSEPLGIHHHKMNTQVFSRMHS